MANLICPVLYAGLLANSAGGEMNWDEARCLGSSCAWWDPKYKLCYIEMIALRS